ncbi:Gfo/Idh/MocA family oxidoreductase [Sulfitobacter sp. D35]|uniref:Gfo/Idh/MocA family protein n=1 Tax=Sulfitobacter sp. D35 TaxID=3083252 RepID=UPI00296EF515|nr:Gfo/Idh/MocA family oxidoreductase [Sulfitobacter sp. D35]MDW4499173.1 Gfo/Idh/MocA family oxidoreductase [Sulfitobacter sp. D35]
MLKVACLGAGYFARFHHDAWSRIEAVDLVAVADAQIERAAASGAPAFASLEALLDAVAPDILDIVTPPPSHAAAVDLALEAGVPLVICQKPFCTSPDEAAAVTARAEARGVRLVIHENFRFQPWYRRMRDALEAGDIGDPMQMTFRLRTGDGQGPQAYLDRQPYFQKMPRFLIRETGVHWIDTFRFMLGPPSSVIADLRQLNPAIAGEDAGYLLMEHEGGRRALFDGNRLLDHAAENLRLTLGEALLEGTGGAMTLTGDGEVRLRRFGTGTARTILKAQEWPGFAGDCVMALNRHVVAHLIDGAPLENEARDYAVVARTEEAAYRSHELGRRERIASAD